MCLCRSVPSRISISFELCPRSFAQLKLMRPFISSFVDHYHSFAVCCMTTTLKCPVRCVHHTIMALRPLRMLYSEMNAWMKWRMSIRILKLFFFFLSHYFLYADVRISNWNRPKRFYLFSRWKSKHDGSRNCIYLAKHLPLVCLNWSPPRMNECNCNRQCIVLHVSSISSSINGFNVLLQVRKFVGRWMIVIHRLSSTIVGANSTVFSRYCDWKKIGMSSSGVDVLFQMERNGFRVILSSECCHAPSHCRHLLQIKSANLVKLCIDFAMRQDTQWCTTQKQVKWNRITTNTKFSYFGSSDALIQLNSTNYTLHNEMQQFLFLNQ